MEEIVWEEFQCLYAALPDDINKGDVLLPTTNEKQKVH